MKNIRGDYDKYEQTLNGYLKNQVSFNTIRSKNHQVYSMNQLKFSLSNYCSKRYFYNAIESLPCGHYMIKDLEKQYN